MRWSDYKRAALRRAAEEAKHADLELERLALRGEFNPTLDARGRLEVLLRYLRVDPRPSGPHVRKSHRGAPQGSRLVRRRGSGEAGAVGPLEFALGLELHSWCLDDGVISLVFLADESDNCQLPIWVHLDIRESELSGWRERAELPQVRSPGGDDDVFAPLLGERPVAVWQERVEGHPYLHIVWSNAQVSSLTRDGSVIPIQVHEDLLFVARQALLAPALTVFSGA